MNFLKKHYEKLILAVCLLIFIASLVIQMDVIKGKDTTVKLNIRKMEYEKVLPDQSAAVIAKEVAKNMIWKKSVRRSASGTGQFTDFTQPINVTFCPKCTSAPNPLPPPALIPFDYLGKKRCPYCGEILPKKEIIDTSKIDTDDDGIPDEMERRMGMDPRNPLDGMRDTDKDGFPVSFEVKYGTKPNDPTSYPPLPLRLYVDKITKPILGIKLVTAKQRGAKKWYLKVNLKEKGKWNNGKRINLGDTIEIDGAEYKVLSVKKITVPGIHGKVGELTLEDVNKKVLKIVQGQDVYSKDVVAEIKDVSNKRVLYTVKKDDVITIKISFPNHGKDGYSKEHKYKVVKIYSGIENKVDLEDLETQKVYTVGAAKFRIGPARRAFGSRRSSTSGRFRRR